MRLTFRAILLFAACLVPPPLMAQQGGGVVVSGPITAGDCTKWVAFNTVGDAGAACGTGGGGTLTAGATATSGYTAGQLLSSNGSVLAVAPTSGANSVVLRDSNQNIVVNNESQAVNSFAATSGTVTLTAASAHTQLITGTLAQTLQLPDETTLAIGASFLITNTAIGTATIKDSGGTTLGTALSGMAVVYYSVSNGSATGNWASYVLTPAVVTWGTLGLNLGSGAITTSGTITGGALAGTSVTTTGPVQGSTLKLTTIYTVGTLPAGVTGTRTQVSDAVTCTFLATLTGGGSVFCPVIYNGTAWVAD